MWCKTGYSPFLWKFLASVEGVVRLALISPPHSSALSSSPHFSEIFSGLKTNVNKSLEIIEEHTFRYKGHSIVIWALAEWLYWSHFIIFQVFT